MSSGFLFSKVSRIYLGDCYFYKEKAESQALFGQMGFCVSLISFFTCTRF